MDRLGTRGLGICFTLIFFHCVFRGERRLSHRERDFSPRAARLRDRRVSIAWGPWLGAWARRLLFGVLDCQRVAYTRLGWGYLGGRQGSCWPEPCAEHFIGVEAAGKSLEAISAPLQSAK